jgi:hypothetical protein
MSWLRSIASGLRSLFRNEQVSQEMDDELSGFLKKAAEESASTAVFSVVDAVLLRAFPYKDAERLVAVWCTEIGQRCGRPWVT